MARRRVAAKDQQAQPLISKAVCAKKRGDVRHSQASPLDSRAADAWFARLIGKTGEDASKITSSGWWRQA